MNRDIPEDRGWRSAPGEPISQVKANHSHLSVVESVRAHRHDDFSVFVEMGLPASGDLGTGYRRTPP